MAKNKNKKTPRKKAGTNQNDGAGQASGGAAAASAESTVKKQRVSPLTFLTQVRSEIEKVTWPSRNEWFVTTMMVFVMVVVASIFFYLVDIVIKSGIQALMGLGG